MNRRFWAAVAVGAVLGGSVAAGFGPCVRSKVSEKAEVIGAQVDVGGVWPTFSGVRLSGVEVVIEELPGVDVRLDQVEVGWSAVLGWQSDQPIVLSGGHVRAVGSVTELLERFEQWRARYFKRREASSGSGRPIELSGFALEWRDRAEQPERQLAAAQVAIGRGKAGLRFEAGQLEGHFDGVKLTARKGRIVLSREGTGYRVAELGSEALELEVNTDGASPVAAVVPGGSSAARTPPSAEATAQPATAPAATTAPAAGAHPRVRAARAAHRGLVALAARLSEVIRPDAATRLAGVRGIVKVGDDSLNLGPGTLSFQRDEGVFVVSLTPSGDKAPGAEAEARTLTFSVRIPLDGEAAAAPARPVVAQVSGGPVWLSTLGVREGDLGLRDVSHASVEADATITLPADGRLLSIDGRGKLRHLAVVSKKLAREPLRDVELAWQAKADISLDGHFVDVKEGELDLGEIRFVVSGRYERAAEAHKVDLRFELPLVPCQQAFDSLPKAMVPKLVGTRFAGSLGAKGHLRFDTAALGRSYDFDWDGVYSCRILEVPPELGADRFRSKFEKLVYTPDGKERTAEFGPGTDTWTPYGSISHFMDGAVLTTEDGRFYRHHGFDQEAIVNSLRENIRAKKFIRGASTISMQTAKNLYLRRERTISRKLQEAILTVYIEQEFTKREIMELYLNIIEFGPMVYGVGPAAKHYFNAVPGRLSLGQAMYLASILPNPQKHYFGAGGAVSPGWMKYLHRLMKILHKIKRISDEELEVGLRETVVFGSPSPRLAPAEDSTDDTYPDDGEGQGGEGDPETVP